MGEKAEILVVEDDPNDVVLLQYAFRKAGVAAPVHILDTGQRALDYLSGQGQYQNREQFPIPRILMIDLKLPLVPGLEVLSWIASRAELANVAVLVLTSSENERDVNEARRRGAQGFLIKPISNEERVQMARFIKQQWLEKPAEGQAVENPAGRKFVIFVAGPRGGGGGS